MNDRIVELAEKAGFQMTKFGLTATPNTNPELFAQLIVQEAVNVCLSERDPQNLNYKPSVKFADAIKSHFGVR